MIPFAVFKMICAFAAGAGLGIGLFYLYLRNRLEKWIKEEQKKQEEGDNIG